MMDSGSPLKIFFLSIIALAAEFFLYLVFGFGTIFSGNAATAEGTIKFFVFLMGLTALIGFYHLLKAIFQEHAKWIAGGFLIIFLFIFLANKYNNNENTKQLDKTQSENILPYDPNSVVEVSSSPTMQVKNENNEKDYINFIDIKNICVEKNIIDTYSVAGEVKNTGNKSVESIEITIYCLDEQGNTIYECRSHPVSDLFDEPLKPNYSRKFSSSYGLIDAPSDWAKKVNVKVSKVEFSE